MIPPDEPTQALTVISRAWADDTAIPRPVRLTNGLPSERVAQSYDPIASTRDVRDEESLALARIMLPFPNDSGMNPASVHLPGIFPGPPLSGVNVTPQVLDTVMPPAFPISAAPSRPTRPNDVGASMITPGLLEDIEQLATTSFIPRLRELVVHRGLTVADCLRLKDLMLTLRATPRDTRKVVSDRVAAVLNLIKPVFNRSTAPTQIQSLIDRLSSYVPMGKPIFYTTLREIIKDLDEAKLPIKVVIRLLTQVANTKRRYFKEILECCPSYTELISFEQESSVPILDFVLLEKRIHSEYPQIALEAVRAAHVRRLQLYEALYAEYADKWYGGRASTELNILLYMRHLPTFIYPPYPSKNPLEIYRGGDFIAKVVESMARQCDVVKSAVRVGKFDASKVSTAVQFSCFVCGTPFAYQGLLAHMQAKHGFVDYSDLGYTGMAMTLEELELIRKTSLAQLPGNTQAR